MYRVCLKSFICLLVLCSNLAQCSHLPSIIIFHFLFVLFILKVRNQVLFVFLPLLCGKTFLVKPYSVWKTFCSKHIYFVIHWCQCPVCMCHLSCSCELCVSKFYYLVTNISYCECELGVLWKQVWLYSKFEKVWLWQPCIATGHLCVKFVSVICIKISFSFTNISCREFELGILWKRNLAVQQIRESVTFTALHCEWSSVCDMF